MGQTGRAGGGPAGGRALDTLDRWHAYIRDHDDAALWAMLHPDAVFESPVVHTPQRGREIVFKYLSSAGKLLGGPDFAYRGAWQAAHSAVLESTSVVDGITVNGVDIITWDRDGLITHFKVMVRPLKAVTVLHARMGAMMAVAGA